MQTLMRDVSYDEPYLPTPRHRIPRLRRIECRLPLEICEASVEAAPVAIVQRHTLIGDHGDRVNQKHWSGTISYRWFAEKLYARVRNNRFMCLQGKPNRPAKLSELYVDSYLGSGFRDAIQAKLDKIAARYLVINGQLWEEIGEPVYVVMTFGLGCNHGGTALMTDNDYNSNIAKGRYFRCDQYREAAAAFKAIAKGRGDTKSNLRGCSRFDILIPEAVKRNPQVEAGEGDPFINRIEGVISAVKEPVAAGLLGMMMAFSSH